MLLLRERHCFFMFDLVSYVRNTLHGKRQIGRNFGGLESSSKKKVIMITNLIRIFSLFLIYLGWTFVKHFDRLIMSTSGSACEILCQRPSNPWYVCRNYAKFNLQRNFNHLVILSKPYFSSTLIFFLFSFVAFMVPIEDQKSNIHRIYGDTLAISRWMKSIILSLYNWSFLM